MIEPRGAAGELGGCPVEALPDFDQRAASPDMQAVLYTVAGWPCRTLLLDLHGPAQVRKAPSWPRNWANFSLS